ncbi:hypothetical protein M426DRAFT_316331 [Hypoxylon sp. CI-4A]|nr:hypothetical protein M426DRAFT_316331 [Hypoxylon sp. CI-4A]
MRPKSSQRLPGIRSTPRFLVGTKYANPADVLHNPCHTAHKTDRLSYKWAMEVPKLMSAERTERQ